MDLVFNNPSHGMHIAIAAGVSYHSDTDVVIAREVNGELAGGFIYTDYTGRGGSMGSHVAGFMPRWITRDLLWCAADYAFNQQGCRRIFGRVPGFKPEVLAFDLKLGWKEVAYIEGVFPEGGCHVLCMQRADCRWLNWKPRTLQAGG